MQALREQLDEATRLQAAQQFANQFIQTPLFQQHQHIALYLPFDGEIDPRYLQAPIWQRGKQCYLPVVSSPPASHMDFYSYHLGDTLILNRYGILQPDPDKSEKCLPENLDLVIVPVVAFDDQRNRLGMGGGYYDRAFAFLRGISHRPAKPYLLGLAYRFQHYPSLPTEEWDVALDEVWEVVA